MDPVRQEMQLTKEQSRTTKCCFCEQDKFLFELDVVKMSSGDVMWFCVDEASCIDEIEFRDQLEKSYERDESNDRERSRSRD